VSVIRAWDDNSVNVRSVTDEILQCLFVPHPFLANVALSHCSFHPDFQDRSSQIQREMLGGIHAWLQSLGHQQSAILARLSKQAVRDHKNVRPGGEGSAPASHGTFATNAGSQMQANVSGYLQGIPGVAQAQGVYNQFGGGSGGRRSGNEFYGPGETMGAGTGSGAVPPAVSTFQRPSGGQAGNYYEETPPFSSQPHASYPGGRSSDAPPLPQSRPPRPPHSPGSHHGHTYGFTPTQPGFPIAPEQSSYVPPGSSFPDPGLPSPYTGGPPSSSSGYPGSSYPGQSYPGQQGTGIPGFPGPGNISPEYSSPAPPNFPGATPSFPSQGGRRFPDPQYDPAYGSGSDSGYGRGSYQPEY
jgi:hypothetical protein